jgi:homogentisate phytyltransferase/homogentisate geranylgeranyltransferase
MVKISSFIQFTRPHTIIATSFQVVGLFILAGGIQEIGQGSLAVLLPAYIACLATNIYIVGLNQLVDVEIDRINKPYLPLAAGKFTIKQGRWIVALVGLLAIGLAMTQGPFLFLTVVIAMLVGTAYSLQPLHLKARPIWAALSIAFVRGFVANIGVYLHFYQKLQPASDIPWSTVVGLAIFFFGFGLVIGLYKDIPDLSGDRQFGIRTFTVRLGPEMVFKSGRLILTGFYLLPILASLALIPALDGFVLLFSHLIIVAVFWSVSRTVDPTEPAAITRFYMFLWSLFYVEYLLIGLNTIAHTGASILS